MNVECDSILQGFFPSAIEFDQSVIRLCTYAKHKELSVMEIKDRNSVVSKLHVVQH